MLVHNWQGGLLLPHGSHLPNSLKNGKKSGRKALIKCDFKFLLLLKPIIGMSEKSFSFSLSRPRTTCNFLTEFSDIWH